MTRATVRAGPTTTEYSTHCHSADYVDERAVDEHDYYLFDINCYVIIELLKFEIIYKYYCYLLIINEAMRAKVA